MFNPKVFGADQTINGGTQGTPALVETLQVSTVAARLFSVTFYNTGASTRYLQFHDTAAAAAANAVPKMQIRVDADQHGSVDWSDGRIFVNGIFVCSSSANNKYTATGASDLLIDANFRKSGTGV